MRMAHVKAVVEEHTEVLQIAQQLERTREDLTKRVKELQDKMRNDLEVRDREIQQLKAAVRKASEDKEAGIKGAKDQVRARAYGKAGAGTQDSGGLRLGRRGWQGGGH